MLINLRNLSALTVGAITLVSMSSTASAHPGHAAPSDELNPLHYLVNPDHAWLTVPALIVIGVIMIARRSKHKSPLSR